MEPVQNPFKKPPPLPTKGGESADAVYLQVGKCLTIWEITENALASLFSCLVSPRTLPYTAQRAYGTLQSARGRKNLIEGAAEVFFRDFPDQELQRHVRELLTAYTDAGSRRNDIAHGVVIPFSIDASDKPDGYVLAPSGWNTNKTGVRGYDPSYIYAPDQIAKLTKDFEIISTRGYELRQALSDHFHSSQQLPHARY